MKEIEHSGFAAETDFGTYVGLHHGAPDTILMIFQRAEDYQGTLTTSVPLRIEAFRTLIALGQRMIESIDHAKSG